MYACICNQYVLCVFLLVYTFSGLGLKTNLHPYHLTDIPLVFFFLTQMPCFFQDFASFTEQISLPQPFLTV